MEKKKYVLKSEEEKVKSADGTENVEHVFDMIYRAEMCLANIQDNTDICINTFKLRKEMMDEDEADAIQILCQQSIEIEHQARKFLEDIEIVKDRIQKHLKVEESKVEEVLKTILVLELHSKEFVEKVLNNK